MKLINSGSVQSGKNDSFKLVNTVSFKFLVTNSKFGPFRL